MRKVPTWTLTLFMACGLALASCGKKGNLETPPQKDKKEELSALSLDNSRPLAL